MKKKFWYVAGIVVVIIIVLIILRKKGVIGHSAGLEVETTQVSRKTITETVNASGKIQPARDIKISADISGEIIELPVKEGDKVKKGQLLVRIKPDVYQRQLEKSRAIVNSSQATLAQSKAAVAQAEANYEKAKLIFNRNKTLYAQKAISTADYENYESGYKVAQAQLKSAQESAKASEYNLASSVASLKESQEDLNKTSVFSPINGAVSKLNVELGERVVGTMQMAGTEMMRVANLADMQVQVDVNENDIVRLRKGDTALINVDAYRDKTFKGVVLEIGSSAENNDVLTTDKVTNFNVKIQILPSSYEKMTGKSPLPTPFRPGMTADATIRTHTVKDVLAVPIEAVAVRKPKDSRDSVANYNDQEVVFLFKDGKAKQTPVKTGIQDDVYIEIKSGLKEGQKIISGPAHLVFKDLMDGDLVREKAGEQSNAGKN